MEEIKEHLHLDVMTVTGKTLGENLDDLKKNGFYKKCDKWLQEFNQRYGIKIQKKILSVHMTKPLEQMEVLQY